MIGNTRVKRKGKGTHVKPQRRMQGRVFPVGARVGDVVEIVAKEESDPEWNCLLNRKRCGREGNREGKREGERERKGEG
ncbi:MAG: hypothetical protein NT031_14110 [Planctomycetota bacterium]|nr:hypothetical protein [Planctomycetota bacterium]